MSERVDPVSFVGLGRMGANMARRLHDVGVPIAAVYDVNDATARDLAAELGATHATTLAAITASAPVVITVVSDDASMDRIFAEHGDSLLLGAEGTTFVNCATVSPAIHRVVESRARAAGAASLEASMASSIPQARNGTLYLMTGGERAVFDRLQPMLAKMSSTLRYIGPSGSAAEVKALVNMVMNINTAGLAEGLGLGDALGLDLDMLRSVFSQTGANSRVLETDGEDMQNREHEVYFSAAHAAKDSGIALVLARERHLTLPLAEATAARYERMIHLGLGDLDKSGIAELTFASRLATEARAR